MINSVDEIIPFSQRHPNETIREIIRYDSGYLKDLFLNDTRVVFSDACIADLCRLTRGHRDNWETPSSPTNNIFHSLKPYRSPYLYDFNNPDIIKINKNRQNFQ